MQTERHGLRNRIEKKSAYLQELEEQVWLSIRTLYLLCISSLWLEFVLCIMLYLATFDFCVFIFIFLTMSSSVIK
jgi:hypothetical protein